MNWMLPVSVKGVLFKNNKVILLKNERNEWELPGGRLEEGETPEECVSQEIYEELGQSCNAKSILDVWVYEVISNKHVLIVTYFCESTDDSTEVQISDEHLEYNWFSIEEIGLLTMPKGYRDSIIRAFEFGGF